MRVLTCDRIIIDASIRRFKAQRVYLRATAALRWINARNQILRGQRATAGHGPALEQVRQQLRQVSSIRDLVTYGESCAD